jgi:AcrR family transcriptional regulator
MIFAREGVSASSVLQITQAAGVSNGTFYHYFANKQELEDAVASRVIAQLQRDLRELQEPRSYAERLALGAVGVMRAIAANHDLGAVMLEYLERNSITISQQAVMLDSDIREGGEAGEFPLTEPRPLLVGMLVAMLGAGARSVLEGADPDQVGELIAAAQLRTLGVPRRRAAAVAARIRSAPALDGDA